MPISDAMANEYQPIEGQDVLLKEAGPLDAFFEGAVLAAEYAAAAINETVKATGFRQIQSTSHSKNDGSPVSAADIASHDELSLRLKAISGFPLVSEEEPGGVPDIETASRSPFFWLADPLDGTRDFLNGETTFAVSLALMRVSQSGGRREIRPYFGCIVSPTSETTWWGSRETPLTKRIHSEDVDLSTESDRDLEVPPRVLGSRSIPSDRLQQLYEFWGVTEITRMGSALKFAMIAEGQFDVYPRFGPTSEWDTAAGQLLLEITGGGLYSVKTGLPLEYGKLGWNNEGFLAVGSQELADKWIPELRRRLG